MMLPRRGVLALTSLACATPAGGSEPGASQRHPDLPIPSHEDQQAWEAATRGMLDARAASGRDAADIREARGLLDAPRALFRNSEAIIGAWRVRSIQITPRGVYVYPWFTLSITATGSGLRLHKDTGSQRRIGVLLRDIDDRFVFLGDAYIPPQTPAAHSALQDDPARADRSRDSVGALMPLSPRRMLLIFAPNAFGAEIYEIAR